MLKSAAMADQLTLFGLWEPVPDPEPAVAPSPEPALPPFAAEPRQTDLFSGHHIGFLQVMEALEALDPGALREAAAASGERYPDHGGPPCWRVWADRLDALLPQDAEALAVCALGDLGASFPGIGEALGAVLRGALLRKAAARLIAAGGPGARGPGGRPAASLLRLAGEPLGAAHLLERAVADGDTTAVVRVELARALEAIGRTEAAVVAWRDALLLDWRAVDEAELARTRLVDALDEASELELPGDARAWAPALADLLHLAPMPAWAADLPDGELSSRLATALARFRGARAAGDPEPALLAHKRALLALVPALRERIRRL